MKYYYFSPVTGTWSHVDGNQSKIKLSIDILTKNKVYAKGETERRALMKVHLDEALQLAKDIDPFELEDFKEL